MCPSTPTPLNRQAQVSCLMPPITRASCQLENFTITSHNTHYTKRQLISHQYQHQHQHTPTPTDKVKPNSKSQKTGKKQNINKAKDLAGQSQTHSSKERES